MKIRKLVLNAFLAIGSILIVSCSETINQVEDTLATTEEEKSSEVEPAAGDSCILSGELSDAEIAGIMEMREEEKLARDVYLFFYDMYGYITFNNISKSEQAHSNAMKYLIDGYGLEDPFLENPGEFTNPDFAELYSTLTQQGSESLVAALKAGAFIEEYDINDLQNLLEETQNADIIRVYSNLLRGSNFHLRAFTFALARQGETYTPTIITEDEYQEITGGSTISE